MSDPDIVSKASTVSRNTIDMIDRAAANFGLDQTPVQAARRLRTMFAATAEPLTMEPKVPTASPTRKTRNDLTS